jgi:Ni,Fe-hydrogenase I large subunit
MESLLDGCGLAPAAMDSTMGRVLSRGIESLVLAQSLPDWLDGLDAALAADVGCTRGDCNLPSSGRGVGRVEVPRGTLCHTIQLEKGRIVDHEYLIPSLWNFSPRDSRGERGPLERALLGTPVADPSHPLEILRTVHELDPCNACLIVIEDIDTGQTTVANAK